MKTRESPLWRWWLFCLTIELAMRYRWEWAGSVAIWCVLPEWVGEVNP